MKTLAPNEMSALRIAGANREGRLITFEAPDGPLHVMGFKGVGPISLGQEGLTRLITRRFIKYSGESSYLLTRTGWEAINQQPPEHLIL